MVQTSRNYVNIGSTVWDYTIREYPQRDYAVGCFRGYWALPIYHHPTRHLPIGVLEIVSPYGVAVLHRRRVLEKLQNLPREVNLTTTCVSLPAEVNSCQDGEIAIIDQALSKVRQIRGLGYADTETWTISGEILSSREGVDFIRKGQGVVGRAFSSKSACFCRDIRQLSITDYPLVPIARSYKYSACFAVCLQSPCPKNCIYVLEFFLHMNEKDEDEEDPRTLLNSLMETLKECLGISFKIASGQELGQKLTVEVIKVSREDEFGSFVICSTTVIGGEGMTKLQMAPFSVEGLGPCELISSHSFNNYYHQWVFWSTCGNDEGGCGKPHHLSATADGAVFTDDIKCCLQLVMETLIPCHCLVQFWGLVKTRDKTYLTTRDQPFALHYGHFNGGDAKKLCEYRKHCLEYLFPVDEDDDDHEIGPPGRVFRSGLPEFAWHVADYTIREYPQRDYAVGRVKEYWALPIYHHPTQHLPIGVLEIVSPSDFNELPRRWVLEKLQNLPWELNLTTTCVSLPAEVNSCQDGEIARIEQALNKVSEMCGLYDAESWTISGEILSSREGVDFIRKGQGVVGRAFSSKSACFCRDVRQLSITEYPMVPRARHLKRSACFAVCLQSPCPNKCIYVLEFFLPMYEEVEDEADYGEDEDEDEADYGEDEDEDKVDYGDPRTLLHSLMETLKECLGSSFMIASGQELGQKLTVEVIKISSKDEYDSFEICNTTGIESTPRLGEVRGEGMMQLDFSSQQVDAANGIHEQQNGSVGSTPRLAKAQGGEGMTQVDFSPQQVDTTSAYMNGVHGQQSGISGSPPRTEHTQELTVGVDVVHNSLNGIYEQNNGIVESPHRQELPQNIENIAHDEGNMEIDVANPERGGASIEPSDREVINIKKQKSSYTLKSELGITREVLEQNSWRNLKDAAKVLQVSRSTLKRICRDFGINRWPPRKARKVNQASAEQRVVQPSTENTEERHRPDTTRLGDDSSIWVKAEYQGDTMKFRLPLSAHKFNLEEKVAQRLNLPIGSFKIQYQDEENEWIWIACDEDLSTCTSTLSSLGRTTIRMLVR
ncbi:protein NLP6-like [Coffea eugenioides]|uniref:protein NLP6-like n=1 Tax=Coffea eugenioides TaxID=49369 RepID=UPI000F609DFC|nr:protein NLP6-like [Coffea eugenioides]